MKRFYFRLKVLLLTFLLGLLSVWIYGLCKEIIRSLNNTAAVINPDKGKTRIFVIPFIIDGEFMKIEIDENERFTMIGHACGNGYAQGYMTSQGDRLNFGLEIIKPKEFKKEISKREIIEKTDGFNNARGEKGTRFILEGQSKVDNKFFYEVVWYDGKEKKYYITAPSLELALEFEKWNESQK